MDFAAMCHVCVRAHGVELANRRLLTCHPTPTQCTRTHSHTHTRTHRPSSSASRGTSRRRSRSRRRTRARLTSSGARALPGRRLDQARERLYCPHRTSPHTTSTQPHAVAVLLVRFTLVRCVRERERERWSVQGGCEPLVGVRRNKAMKTRYECNCTCACCALSAAAGTSIQ
jgi:hypothetical protein